MEFTEQFLRDTDFVYQQDLICRPPIICKDGFEVSIQASRMHCSIPRRDGSWWYDSFELGYPSQPDELIEEYSEYDDSDVYPYTPREVVNALVEKHGGFDHFKGEA